MLDFHLTTDKMGPNSIVVQEMTSILLALYRAATKIGQVGRQNSTVDPSAKNVNQIEYNHIRSNYKLTFIRVMVTLLPALGKGVWCYENVICFQKGS